MLASDPKPGNIPASAQVDSTTYIRSRLGLLRLQLNQKALRETQHTSLPPFSAFEPQAHICAYVVPWAIPVFQFRSGVELLGIIVNTLTSNFTIFFFHASRKLTRTFIAHQQAASSCSVETPHDFFPFHLLHQDPSVLNIGMVTTELSDFPVCKLCSKGECRGLLYDWGFAKVAEVAEYGGMDLEEDSDVEVLHCSSDTDMAPHSTIHVPIETRTDSGFHTATPDIIDDFEMLVRLVRHCIREESVMLEITVCITIFPQLCGSSPNELLGYPTIHVHRASGRIVHPYRRYASLEGDLSGPQAQSMT